MSPNRPPGSRGAGPGGDTHIWWRAAVWGFVSCCAALYVISVPPAFRQMRTPCGGDACPAGAVTPIEAAGLARLGLTPNAYALFLLVLVTVLAGVYLAVAVLLLRLAGRRAPALYGASVLAAIGVAFPQTLPALASSSQAWSAAVTLVERASFLALVCWALTFPDGRFRPRWTAAIPLGMAVYEATVGVVVSGDVDLVLTVGLFALVAGVQVWRHRRPVRERREAERATNRWVGLAFGIALVSLILAATAQGPLGVRPGSVADIVVQGGIVVAFLGIPVSVAAGVLRRGLWDASASVGRAVTYGTLTILVALAYTTIVTAAAAALSVDHTGIAVAVAGTVAVAVHPGYVWLRRGVNRLLYGQRDDPAAVLDDLAKRLSSAAEPEGVLASVAQTLVRALRLPYVRVVVDNGELPHGEAGHLPEGWPTDEFELVHHGRQVGLLTVARRDPDGSPTRQDLQAVDAVARQAAVLAHNATLTHELRASRRELVAAREEERRRLRNDLHDGLGPALAAVALKLSAAGNLLPADPDLAAQRVNEARQQTMDAVADVRRLVYGLRPPSLDEMGLVDAVIAFSRGVEHGTSTAIDVATRDGAPLPELPAAVEVAAYRIALEALTNVLRHAVALTCSVRFALEPDAFTVEVRDDGRGVPPGVSGVGMASMRDRAAELGGVLTITAGAAGTRVVATLPLDADVLATAEGQTW